MSTESPDELALAAEVERLRARVRELETRHASLRLLVQNLPIGLFSMEDPRSGTLTQVNPALARTFGYPSAEEFEGASAYEAYADPKERDETFARFLADPRFRETGIARFESVRVRRDGSSLPVLITVSATFGPEGKIARFDGAIEDLSERKRAERSFMASEQRFRIVFETVDVGVALTHVDGTVMRANPALCRFLRCSERELVGKPLDDALDELDRATPLVGAAPAAPSELRKGAVERRFRTAEGDLVWGYAVVTWLADADGRAVQAAIVIQDVTLRRKLEDEMSRVQKLESLALLAGGIAHDFNNFLAAILGNITLARRGRDDLDECLAGAQDAALRARDVTRQLLTFAKGGAPLKKVGSLVAVAREAAAFCLRGSGVECVFREAPGLPMVELDPGQMGQVFSNLLINAVEAMSGGGTIQIDAACVEGGPGSSLPLDEGRHVRVSVTDHGAGIAQEHLSHVFDPYFTTKERGSGLGLATVYSIVKRHGGHVELSSEPARGTTVSVYLSAAPPSAQTEEEPEPFPMLARRARILVMDDDAAVRKVVARALEGVGCDVTAAADGAAALVEWEAASAAGRAFDVAILDLTVRGGMGGEETMRRLLALDPTARAIVSSGYSDSPVMSRFADFGFAGVAAKPYSLNELLQTLHTVLEGRKG